VQDVCDGHPQGIGQYHYHGASPGLPGANANAVVGWALDDYPILGMRDAKGVLVTNAGLDACHAPAENVSLDGRRYDYAYRLTQQYPHLLGCVIGTVSQATQQAIRQAPRPPRAAPPGRQLR
jgi:hypothetical protein